MVRVGAGTLGNLKNDGSVFLLAGLGDALHDLHVVDVERADGVAAVIRLLEHFGRGNEWHDIVSFCKVISNDWYVWYYLYCSTENGNYKRKVKKFSQKRETKCVLCLSFSRQMLVLIVAAI